MRTRLLMLLTMLLVMGASAMAQAAGGQVPKMKVAIVDVLSFRERIGELKVKYDKLQGEFTPRYQELEALQSKLAAQEKTLQENTSLTPQQAAKLSEEFESGKKEYQRKLEDSQTMARKREEEETGPIYDKLSKYLDVYCTKNGITHVFDARKLQETGIVVFAAASANITDVFVTEYNKNNPAPAAAAAPKQ